MKEAIKRVKMSILTQPFAAFLSELGMSLTCLAEPLGYKVLEILSMMRTGAIMTACSTGEA